MFCSHCQKAFPAWLYAQHIRLSPHCYFKNGMRVPAGISQNCLLSCPFCPQEMHASELPVHLVTRHRNSIPPEYLKAMAHAAPLRAADACGALQVAKPNVADPGSRASTEPPISSSVDLSAAAESRSQAAVREREAMYTRLKKALLDACLRIDPGVFRVDAGADCPSQLAVIKRDSQGAFVWQFVGRPRTAEPLARRFAVASAHGIKPSSEAAYTVQWVAPSAGNPASYQVQPEQSIPNWAGRLVEICRGLNQLEQTLSSSTAPGSMPSRSPDFFVKDLPKELTLGEKRLHSRSRPRAFYGLWMGSSPVYQVYRGRLRFLAARTADEPLVFDVIPQRRIGRRVSRHDPHGGCGLGARFCVDDGRAIPLGMRPHVERIFRAVEEGTPILGNGRVRGSGGSRLQSFGGCQWSVKDRPWSQGYLRSLGPNRITAGRLRGSGNRYIAFQFGRIVVVEYDAEGHATYLFRSDQFDRLKQYPRQDLLNERPRGFLGRVIHRGREDAWKATMRRVLKDQR